jgi:hypothetical protein
MPGPIDSNVDPAAVFWWQELINCCEYGCKLAAYAGFKRHVPDSGQETAEKKQQDGLGNY